MSRPIVVMLALGPRRDRAAAISDPQHFLVKHKDVLDTYQRRYLAQAALYPIAEGTAWGLLLPGDFDVGTIRELYGEQVAESLEAAVAKDPTCPVAWKVVECITRGWDGAALNLEVGRSR